MNSRTQRPVKVLLVEHDSDGLGGLRPSLQRVGGPDLDVAHVAELSEGLEHLSREEVDVVLLDLWLPDSRGVNTFERAHAFAPHVPFVVVTDRDDEELGVKTVQGGAQDYLLRDEVEASEIVRSMRYAIERHRLLTALRSLSLIDELTGLYNGRGFTQLGEQYLKLARRSDRGGALLFVDVDRFQTINRALGHHVGDRALLELGNALRATVRGADLVGRLVADEFAVLALGPKAASGSVLVERIRDEVETLNARRRDPYQLEVSIGMALFEPDDSSSLQDLLEEAAAAMQDGRRYPGEDGR